MANGVNDDCLFVVENLIDGTVITHAKLIETCKITCQWLDADDVKICGQPIDRSTMWRPTCLSKRAKFRDALARMRMKYTAVTPPQVVVLHPQTVRHAHLLPQTLSDAGVYHAQIF